MEISKTDDSFWRRMKNLAADQNSHPLLIRDADLIRFFAVSLEGPEDTVVSDSLRILQLLAKNKQNLLPMNNIFGIREALQSVLTRESTTNAKKRAAKEIVSALDRAAVAPRMWKNTFEDENEFQASYSFVLFISGLNFENVKYLEVALVSVKGVVSFHINVPSHQCTVRVIATLRAQTLAAAIKRKTNLEASMVTRNKFGHEVYIPLLEDTAEDLPAYLPDNESPVKEKAVTVKTRVQAASNSILQWFQESFYW